MFAEQVTGSFVSGFGFRQLGTTRSNACESEMSTDRRKVRSSSLMTIQGNQGSSGRSLVITLGESELCLRFGNVGRQTRIVELAGKLACSLKVRSGTRQGTELHESEADVDLESNLLSLRLRGTVKSETLVTDSDRPLEVADVSILESEARQERRALTERCLAE